MIYLFIDHLSSILFIIHPNHSTTLWSISWNSNQTQSMPPNCEQQKPTQLNSTIINHNRNRNKNNTRTITKTKTKTKTENRKPRQKEIKLWLSLFLFLFLYALTSCFFAPSATIRSCMIVHRLFRNIIQILRSRDKTFSKQDHGAQICCIWPGNFNNLEVSC